MEVDGSIALEMHFFLWSVLFDAFNLLCNLNLLCFQQTADTEGSMYVRATRKHLMPYDDTTLAFEVNAFTVSASKITWAACF